MLEFTVLGVRVRFSFLFFAVVTAMMMIDRSGVAACGLLCCILHESGHVAAFAALRKKPENLTFEAVGIKLRNPPGLISFKSELFVLSAGCAVNFLLAAAFYKIDFNFFMSNLIIGIFNLMPVMALDGGKILYTLLCMKLLPESAKIAVTAVSVITVVPIMVLGGLLFYSTKNITMLLTSAYLLTLLILKSGE